MKPGIRTAVIDRRSRLLAALATGEHRNGQLAATIGATPSQVGSDLRYLERMGLVDWRGEEIRQFYCPECDTVVTADNYDECKGEMFPFWRAIRVWSLTAAGRSALRTMGGLARSGG